MVPLHKKKKLLKDNFKFSLVFSLSLSLFYLEEKNLIEDIRNILRKEITAKGFKKPLSCIQGLSLPFIDQGDCILTSIAMRSRRLPWDYLDETLRAINAR